jgi:excisionase family DNA binding protein
MDAPSAAYISAEEVAELLSVSVKSVRRWAAADATMPVLRIGGTVRFPRERLERWLRDREQGRAGARRPSRKPMRSAAQVPDSARDATAASADCANPCAVQAAR